MTESTNTQRSNPVEQFDMYVAHVGLTQCGRGRKDCKPVRHRSDFQPLKEPPFFAGTLVEVTGSGARKRNQDSLCLVVTVGDEP